MTEHCVSLQESQFSQLNITSTKRICPILHSEIFTLNTDVWTENDWHTGRNSHKKRYSKYQT